MDDKDLIIVLNKMTDIIDILPELENDCPDIKDAASYQKMHSMREELLDYMEKRTAELNQTADMIMAQTMGGDVSKDN